MRARNIGKKPHKKCIKNAKITSDNVSSFFFDDRGGIKYGDDNKDGHWTTTTRTTKNKYGDAAPSSGDI